MPGVPSARLIVVVNNCAGARSDNHCDTFEFGEGRIASEMTFVSRMIIAKDFLDPVFGNGFARRYL